MNIAFDIIRHIEWTALKARLHISAQIQHPQKKEVWWVALGQNIGVEMNGKNASFECPVLVLRELSAESMLVVPMTSQLGKHKYNISFTDSIGMTSAANIHQIRTLSVRRFLRKVSVIDDPSFNEIIDAIISHVLIKAKLPDKLGVPQRPLEEGE